MGKKEENSPKTDTSNDELSKDLEDVDDNAVVDEIPDEILLNEPLDDEDLTNDFDTITRSRRPKKLQNKQQGTPFQRQRVRKPIETQLISTLEGSDADEDILAEMEGILSGKAPSPSSSKIKTKLSSGRILHTSIYIQIIQAMLFLNLCLLGGFYIPLTLLIEESGGKYVFFALHATIGIIIIAGEILFFRYPRIALLFSFIVALWTVLGWMILYFWIGFSLSYGWWAFPLLCVVISGILVYFTIQYLLHDPSFTE